MKKRITKVKTRKKKFLKQNLQAKTQFEKIRLVNFFGLGIVVLLGILIYSNSFYCSFHLDDISKIVDNLKIRDLSDIKTIWNYSQTRFTAYYSFAINYHFGNLDVWGYHLFNLSVHLINACLVYWLTLLIFSSPALKDHSIIKDKGLIAFITALLFVTHPLATQSVTYIVQRMACMVATFYLLSLALYFKGRLSQDNSILKYSLYAGVLISAILAMLTKENSFTLPFAILIVEIFLFQTKKLSINFKDYRVILFIVGFMSFIMLVIFHFSVNIFDPILPNKTNDFRLVTSQNYLFTQFSVIVKYIQLLLLPINQNLDYDFPISNSFFEIGTISSFVLLLSSIILAIFLFKKNRIFSFGIFWFFLTLSIESSIIPISDLIFEHRTYLPSFGFFLILSSGIYLLLWNKYKYIAISVFTILIGGYSLLTYERNKIWKDDLTLWSDVISKSPNKARSYSARGNFLLRNEKKYSEALSDYNKAIELSPYYAEPYANRGSVYENLLKYNEALNDYNKAIDLNPNYATAYFNRGNIFNREKKYAKALEDYSKAIELNPNYAKAYMNRGNIFKSENNYARAVEDYTKAIESNPSFADPYNNRATVYEVMKKYREGIRDLNKAIELNPNFAMAYYNRGMAELKLGDNVNSCLDFQKAIELGMKAVEEVYNKNCR